MTKTRRRVAIATAMLANVVSSISFSPKGDGSPFHEGLSAGEKFLSKYTHLVPIRSNDYSRGYPQTPLTREGNILIAPPRVTNHNEKPFHHPCSGSRSDSRNVGGKCSDQCVPKVQKSF